MTQSVEKREREREREREIELAKPMTPALLRLEGIFFLDNERVEVKNVCW